MSKNIIILNGSPRLKGNTAMLCDAFMKGAESAGHAVTRFDLQKLDIHGCLGCMKGGKNPASHGKNTFGCNFRRRYRSRKPNIILRIMKEYIPHGIYSYPIHPFFCLAADSF